VYRYLIAITVLVAIIGLWLFLADDTQPVTEPEPLPVLLQIPQEYRAELNGLITLGDNIVPGRVLVDYQVYPDLQVVVTNLAVWMDDLDLVTPFLWWEVVREPLRCTFFRNDGAITGVLDNGELVIPAGATILGHSFLKRDAQGKCTGKARRLDTASNAELRIIHDPAGNHIALSAAFDTSHEDNTFTVSLEAEGHYLNRPPVVELVVSGENVTVGEDGCPSVEKGKPPIALANTPDGLQITLKSISYDPDGNWPKDFNLKRPRVDIAAEQWARSRRGGFSYLGEGRDIGPLLFEIGREHQLLLWVTDRYGAEARKLCHFQVIKPR